MQAARREEEWIQSMICLFRRTHKFDEIRRLAGWFSLCLEFCFLLPSFSWFQIEKRIELFHLSPLVSLSVCLQLFLSCIPTSVDSLLFFIAFSLDSVKCQRQPAKKSTIL